MLPYPSPYLSRNVSLGSTPHLSINATFLESLGSQITLNPCTRGSNPSNKLSHSHSTPHKTEGNPHHPLPPRYIPPLVRRPCAGSQTHTHPRGGDAWENMGYKQQWPPTPRTGGIARCITQLVGRPCAGSSHGSLPTHMLYPLEVNPWLNLVRSPHTPSFIGGGYLENFGPQGAATQNPPTPARTWGGGGGSFSLQVEWYPHRKIGWGPRHGATHPIHPTHPHIHPVPHPHHPHL